MQHWNFLRNAAITVACGFILAGLSACPPQGAPPFDVTGTYAGVYGLDDAPLGVSDNCNLTLQLYQRVDIPLIQSTFAGLARLDWDCLLAPWMQDLLGITSETAVLPVLAVLRQDGSYSLEFALSIDDIPAALLGDIDESEASPTNSFERFDLAFNGTGADTDQDGFMDMADGSLAVLLEFRDENQDLVTIDASGTFTASVVMP